ncbi:MAG: putative DNA binding domain-containing protein [Gammaproteobacteria bacterium]|nr:putative DNA binding domain-containing protein [Gammaproteobacteria bacterium]
MLLAGVDDDGRIMGISSTQIKLLDDLLVEVSSDAIEPPVRISTHHKEMADGKLVLLVQVPEGYSAHRTQNGAYVRVGAAKRLMSGDEYLRLAQRRSQARFLWFDKQPVPNTGFKTLGQDLWKPLLSSKGVSEPGQALKKLALVDDEDGILRATLAGVLLCTPNPDEWLPNACITATFYRGSDRTSDQIDSKEIAGPLNKQISDAVSFVAKNMQVAARKDPARIEVPQYSEKAVFEALVNAVVHRDYSIQGSRIRLSMFDSRLEIQSPGSLPNNLTVESISARQSSRNEAIVSVLSRMSVGGIRGSSHKEYIMERRGDGVPIILEETMELCGKYPEYRVIDEAEVLLVIPAANQEFSSAFSVISVRSGNQPLEGVSLLLVYPNKTWVQATTNDEGEATVHLYTTDLPMTVFAAAPEYAAHIESGWIPSQRPLALNLDHLPKGGSAVFAESTGYLPGLKGRINPIRDAYDRTYLYASNIAINGGQQQPVYFVAGEQLRLTDANGKEILVRVIAITGRSSLIEYFNAGL